MSFIQYEDVSTGKGLKHVRMLDVDRLCTVPLGRIINYSSDRVGTFYAASCHALPLQNASSQQINSKVYKNLIMPIFTYWIICSPDCHAK